MSLGYRSIEIMKVQPTTIAKANTTRIIKKVLPTASALGIVAGFPMGPGNPVRDAKHIPGTSVEDPIIERVGYFADRAIDVGEEVVDHLLGVSGTILRLVIVLLSAELIGRYEGAVGLIFIGGMVVAYALLLVLGIVESTVLDEAMEPELCRAPHHGEGLGQELLVLGVAPVHPEVAGVPYVGHEVVVPPGTHTII